MNRHKVSTAEAVSAAAAVLGVVALVLPWFRERAVARFGTGLSPLVHFAPRTKMAWVAIPVIAVLIVAVAAVPVWNVVKRSRTGRSLRPEALLASGAVAVGLVLLGTSLHVGEQGGSPGPGAVISSSPAWGLWVTLVLALGWAGGGAVAMWSRRPIDDGLGSLPNS